MDLAKCTNCGNESFTKKHYFEKFNDTYHTHLIVMVCDKCGEPLWLTQDNILGGF